MASSSATTAATASRADSAAAPAHNHSKATSPKEQGDPDLDVSLPYRTLAPGADMTEYTTETAQGSIPGPAVATGAAPPPRRRRCREAV
ncbi:hypothetical protein MN608_09756 [Microdochium nivale]|nr:hypothetical protein MN608_09756 [Microdochium nivale]